jgi:hypothetical protein
MDTRTAAPQQTVDAAAQQDAEAFARIAPEATLLDASEYAHQCAEKYCADHSSDHDRALIAYGRAFKMSLF